jgi:hypothetical protein
MMDVSLQGGNGGKAYLDDLAWSAPGCGQQFSFFGLRFGFYFGFYSWSLF